MTDLLCFVHGQGQKSEQKHRTNNFAKLLNHLPLLTMVSVLYTSYLHSKFTKHGFLCL